MEIAFLLLAFVVAQLVGALGKKKQRERRRVGPADEQPRDLLAELRGALEEMQKQGRTQAPIARRPGEMARREGPMGRRLPPYVADDDEEEEPVSLERTPTVVSLEGPVVYEQRPLVDHDDEIEAVVASRIRYAEKQARALTLADHRKFDQRIRQPVAPKVPSARSTYRAGLRDLFVAREILGPPVSLSESAPATHGRPLAGRTPKRSS